MGYSYTRSNEMQYQAFLMTRGKFTEGNQTNAVARIIRLLIAAVCTIRGKGTQEQQNRQCTYKHNIEARSRNHF
jgi:hypothetical protein